MVKKRIVEIKKRITLKRIVTAVELLLIIFFGYHLYMDIEKVPVVKDYIYMIVIESLGIDIYIKIKNKFL